jgi:serine protease Do
MLVSTPAWPSESSCIDRTAIQNAATDFVAAAAREKPAVVRISAIGADGWTDWPGGNVAFPVGGGETQPWHRSDERTSASGFVIRHDGYVLTSAHAVVGAEDVSVAFTDGRSMRAQIVGFDRRTDVALLKVPAANLPEALIVPNRMVCAGEWVAALGSPLGFDSSLAAGIVSAFPRYLPRGSGVPLIQTDVALSRGSSGGPLFNARGEVVGLNSMIYSNSGEYVGLSFSLPIDEAMRVVRELLESGHVTRGQLGAGVQGLTPELARAFGLAQAAGALVTRVDKSASVGRAGLRTGDIILGVGAAATAAAPEPMTYAEIQQQVASSRPGSEVILTVWRPSGVIKLSVLVASAGVEEPRRRDLPVQELHERLGLKLAELEPDVSRSGRPAGLYVQGTSGASRRAGIEFGDAVLGINQTMVSNLVEFDEALRAAGARDTVAILVRRGAVINFVPISRQPR